MALSGVAAKLGVKAEIRIDPDGDCLKLRLRLLPQTAKVTIPMDVLEGTQEPYRGNLLLKHMDEAHRALFEHVRKFLDEHKV